MLYYNNPKNYEWFRVRGPFSFIVKKEIGAVKSILDMLHYREVLDVGCGTGIYSRIFPGDKNYTGLEPDKRMYEFCSINADLKVTTFSRFKSDHSWPVKLANT